MYFTIEVMQPLSWFVAEGDEMLLFSVPPEEFTSKKITTKILQQIEVWW